LTTDVHSVDLLDEILAPTLLFNVGRILEEDEAETALHVLKEGGRGWWGGDVVSFFRMGENKRIRK
jgi:hypothetical protein